MCAAEADLAEGREPRVADHALAHRDQHAIERGSAAAGQSRPGADKLPADMRAEQVHLAAGRESVVQLEVAIDCQLRGPQSWQVAARHPQCRNGGLGEVNRLLEPATQQQHRARQPRRLQVQRPGNAGSRQAQRSRPFICRDLSQQMSQHIRADGPPWPPHLTTARIVGPLITVPQISQRTRRHRLAHALLRGRKLAACTHQPRLPLTSCRKTAPLSSVCASPGWNARLPPRMPPHRSGELTTAKHQQHRPHLSATLQSRQARSGSGRIRRCCSFSMRSRKFSTPLAEPASCLLSLPLAELLWGARSARRRSRWAARQSRSSSCAGAGREGSPMAQPAPARPKINTEVTQPAPGGVSRRLTSHGKTGRPAKATARVRGRPARRSGVPGCPALSPRPSRITGMRGSWLGPAIRTAGGRSLARIVPSGSGSGIR